MIGTIGTGFGESRPGAVVGPYTAVSHRNGRYAGAFRMTGGKLRPVHTVPRQDVPQSISAANQRAVAADPLKMSAAIITTVPIMCACPFARKSFAKGVPVGAGKGRYGA